MTDVVADGTSDVILIPKIDEIRLKGNVVLLDVDTFDMLVYCSPYTELQLLGMYEQAESLNKYAVIPVCEYEMRPLHNADPDLVCVLHNQTSVYGVDHGPHRPCIGVTDYRRIFA